MESYCFPQGTLEFLSQSPSGPLLGMLIKTRAVFIHLFIHSFTPHSETSQSSKKKKKVPHFFYFNIFKSKSCTHPHQKLGAFRARLSAGCLVGETDTVVLACIPYFPPKYSLCKNLLECLQGIKCRHSFLHLTPYFLDPNWI